MRRDDWRRVLEKDITTGDFAWHGLGGKISLMKIRKITEPLTVGRGDMRAKIVETGFSWIQIALEGQFFWLTSMFDEQGRLIQIYIDMTDGNVTSGDDPYFDDMYLDFVVSRGKIWELDRDELDEALKSGAITRAQYERTLSEGAKVRAYLEAHPGEVEDLLRREYARLNGQAKHGEFLHLAALLNRAMDVTPLLFGSLGLEKRLNAALNADDIDILVPEALLAGGGWTRLSALMTGAGYALYDEHEHAFEKDGVSAAFASIEGLAPFAGVDVDAIPFEEEDGARYRLLTLADYMKVYEASSKDGYRKTVKHKKDGEKIALIRKALSL